MSEIIQHVIHPGARERITIHKRADGFFECSHDKFYVDDLPECDHHMEYWGTVHRWGLFDSIVTAKNEAAAQFPWVGADDSGHGD